MKKTYDFVPENMSMETYGKFIHQMKKFPDKLKMLCLMGQGEPLINKDIPVMVKMAKDAEIAERVEIISNGSLHQIFRRAIVIILLRNIVQNHFLILSPIL